MNSVACRTFFLTSIALVAFGCKESSFISVWGGWSDDVSSQMIQAGNGYIVIGSTRSGSDGQQVALVRLDGDGDTLWVRQFGGPLDDTGLAICKANRGYLILSTGFTAESERTYNLAMINNSGEILWDDSLPCSSQFPQGGLLEGEGNTFYVALQQNTGIMLQKVDPDGEFIWTCPVGQDLEAVYAGFCQNSNGELGVLGTIVTSSGSMQLLLVGVTEEGSVHVSKTYSEASLLFGSGIASTGDGFVIAGTTLVEGNGFDVYVLRTDSEGNLIWSRTYGEEGDDLGGEVAVQDDGQILVASTSNSGSPSDDIRLLGIDADGNNLWTRSIGGEQDESPSSLVMTKGDGFALSGWTESYGNGMRDMLFCRLAGDGANEQLEYPTRNSNPLTFAKEFEVVPAPIEMEYGDPVIVNSVYQCLDGGFMLGYNVNNDIESRTFLLKTNSSGDSLWTKEIAGGWNYSSMNLFETLDGGFMSISEDSAVKYTPDMDVFWARSHERFPGIIDVIECIDGYVLLGIRPEWDSETWNVGERFGVHGSNGCIYLSKLDKDLEVEWLTSYSVPAPSGGRQWGITDLYGRNVLVSTGDSFVFCFSMNRGSTAGLDAGFYSQKGLVAAVSTDGRWLWTTELVANSRRPYRYANQVQQVGELIVVLGHRSDLRADEGTEAYSLSLLDLQGNLLADDGIIHDFPYSGDGQQSFYADADGYILLDMNPTMYSFAFSRGPGLCFYDVDGNLLDLVRQDVEDCNAGYRCYELLRDELGARAGFVIAGVGGEVSTRMLGEGDYAFECPYLPQPRLFLIRTDVEGSI